MSLRLRLSEYGDKIGEAEAKLKLERIKVTELSKEKETLQQQLLCSEIQGLKEEVKREQDKAVQLWHANCQQLLTHDSEMFEKEREIQVLCDRLQRTEMELATLKMERLRVGTHQSVSQSIYTDTVEPVVGAANVNL